MKTVQRRPVFNSPRMNSSPPLLTLRQLSFSLREQRLERRAVCLSVYLNHDKYSLFTVFLAAVCSGSYILHIAAEIEVVDSTLLLLLALLYSRTKVTLYTGGCVRVVEVGLKLSQGNRGQVFYTYGLSKTCQSLGVAKRQVRLQRACENV